MWWIEMSNAKYCTKILFNSAFFIMANEFKLLQVVSPSRELWQKGTLVNDQLETMVLKSLIRSNRCRMCDVWDDKLHWFLFRFVIWVCGLVSINDRKYLKMTGTTFPLSIMVLYSNCSTINSFVKKQISKSNHFPITSSTFDEVRLYFIVFDLSSLFVMSNWYNYLN